MYYNIKIMNANVSTEISQVKSLVKQLKEEKDAHIKGGIYHKVQTDLTYNSNHIEGSKLTEEQTRYIFETNTINAGKENIKVDDVIETVNHFKCIDFVIDNIEVDLTENFIKQLHFILKSGTSESRLDWFKVGDYKFRPNIVADRLTTPPELVHTEMLNLLSDYSKKKSVSLDDIIDFHYRFEKIHPFQDGNGRVGRLIMFKECLKNGIIPFIVYDNFKMFYYRGLSMWITEKGYLRDTLLTCQDTFKNYLKYFRI